MKIIPTFKPSFSVSQLNQALAAALKDGAQEKARDGFVSSFCRYIGVKRLVPMPSARLGLYFILKNLGVPSGSEIILSAFNYFAVPLAIAKAGMTPVFVDIDRDNFNIDVNRIERAITHKTKAIIATHLCGFVCNMNVIRDIAKSRNLFLIEDCVQSPGAEYERKKAGSIGCAAFFSFGVTKPISALGNGAVATGDEKLAASLESDIRMINRNSSIDVLPQLLKAYGICVATSGLVFPAVYSVMLAGDILGINLIDMFFGEKHRDINPRPLSGLLNKLQADLGFIQLCGLEEDSRVRMEKGLLIYHGLKDTPGVGIPKLEQNSRNTFSSCPVKIRQRNAVKKLLLKKGIVTSSGFMCDCSSHPMFSEFKSLCRNAEEAQEEIIYLPLFSRLKNSEIEYMIRKIKDISAGLRQ